MSVRCGCATQAEARAAAAVTGGNLDGSENDIGIDGGRGGGGGGGVVRAVPSKVRKLVAFRQEYKCAGCGCLLPPTYEIDHVTPLALGGSNGMPNLQVCACVRACGSDFRIVCVAIGSDTYCYGVVAVSYTHLTLPTKRIV